MTSFGRRLRRKFLLEPGTAFLNHGSFGVTPRSVLAFAERWRKRMEANPDRFMREILPVELRRAAGSLARFLHASARDLAFVENATAGVNAVLRSLAFKPGDEIVATTHTYNAVRQTLRHVCAQSGARLVEARIELPVKDADTLLRAFEDRIGKRTRLVLVDHISSPTGLIFPVKKIARLARNAGARVLVDGAHAPGQLALDIPALGVDWYAGNCHKWLFAPKGCAFLWASRGAQDGLHPPVISHGYQSGFTAEFDWTGTRDFCNWLALPQALEFFAALGPRKIRAYNHRLVADAARLLSEAWASPADAPPQLHASLAAVRLPVRWQRRDPRRLMSELQARHRIVAAIMPLQGVLWARVSGQVYNAPADYLRLAQAFR